MKRYFTYYFFVVVLLTVCKTSFCQSDCPPNIGFEDGTFSHWECFVGTVDVIGDVILNSSAPNPNQHVIWRNNFPQTLDFYGQFPVNCPNGSNYSIQLGNNSTGKGAERVSYTFQVPANKNEFSIIYHYAVVFQDPGHAPYEQPKFTVNVINTSSTTPVSCGTFEYVASGSLPGFKKSNVGVDVYYKPWSPVTVKLNNCAGKQITLEFTTNDCTRGGHFGYAYIDVDENCVSPIQGNVYCSGATSIKLTAPFGFKAYNWYDENFTTLLGTSNTLTIAPPPPAGTKYALEIIPYPGIGCQDTIYTTIVRSPDDLTFKVKTPVTGCAGNTVDLTDSLITAGSSHGLIYSYFKDPDGLEYYPTPAFVDSARTIYVKAVNTSGCTEIKAVSVDFLPDKFKLTNPPVICYPGTANLTDSSIYTGSDTGYQYTYFSDWGMTPLTNPSSITQSGTYYIKAKSSNCTYIKPIVVEIRKASGLETFPANGCEMANLTDKKITKGTEVGFTLTYWKDSTCTIPVTDPTSLTEDGIFYLKGIDVAGCSLVKPVSITILNNPVFTVTDPQAVTAPSTIALSSCITASSPNVFFSFLRDSLATQGITNPQNISVGGTYYIKGTNANGCAVVKPVHLIIYPPPPVIFNVPNAFSPNNDGINDVLRISFQGYPKTTKLSIYDRWGQVVFSTSNIFNSWDGTFHGKPLPTGTYYWIIDAVEDYTGKKVRMSGNVTLLH